MVPDVLYRDYRISFDVEEAPLEGFWKVQAAVVKAADATRVERGHLVIASQYFSSEKAAIDFIIAEAKKWIDTQREL